MSITDVILTITLIVLAGTMWSQKKLTATQLLRDRYQMFFDSWSVTPDDVQQFRAKTHLFVEKKRIDAAYLDGLLRDESDNAIKSYLLIVQLYEYLAFAHTFNTNSMYLGKSAIGKCWDKFFNCLREALFRESKPIDPYGEEWVKRLVTILITEKDETDFPHVHDSYKDDHREFYCFVEKVKKELGRPTDPDCNEYIKKYEDMEIT